MEYRKALLTIRKNIRNSGIDYEADVNYNIACDALNAISIDAGFKEERDMDKDKMTNTRREMETFNNLLDKVWDEELTDRQELIYLKFFIAGVKCGKDNDRR